MRIRPVTLLVTATVLAACGGGSGGDQGEVADLFIQAADEEGFELDRECVETAAAKLSDDDARKILDAGIDGDPDVSDDANAVADEMADCLPIDSLIDSLLEEFGDDDTVDTACLRDELAGVANPTELSARIFDALSACTVGG